MKTRLYHIGAVCSALLFLTFTAGAASDKSITTASDISFRNEVQHAIDKGLGWLQANQNTNGWWSTADQPAVTALALTAFMGEPSGNYQAHPPAAIQHGYQFITANAKPDGSIYGKGLQNYNTSICMMGLIAAHNPNYDPLLRRGRQWLLTQQVHDPGDPRDGGVGYGDHGPYSDMNNTMHALEALYYSKYLDADENRDRTHDLNWSAAIRFIQSCQNLPGVNKASWVSADPKDQGGFVYAPGDTKSAKYTNAQGRVALRSYGSISYAGLLSYIYADLKKDDPRVKAAFDWVRQNYTLDENPGMGPQGLYYYLHLMTKALQIYGVDQLPLSSGQQVDWRKDVAMKLINLQKADGSWENANGRWWEKDPGAGHFLFSDVTRIVVSIIMNAMLELRFAALLLLAASLPTRADDWPNWRGPNHNGISSETGWVAKWPADGPPQLWKASVGTGFSSVTVSKGRAYTMGNKDDVDTIYCFDAETGHVVWKKSYPCPADPLYYEGGTSATPTVDGNAVYTLSKHGNLYCLAADSGAVLWSKDLPAELGLEIPKWGFASSALVEGNLLVLNVGWQGTAFDKASGKVEWTTGKLASGYSTPLPCSFSGKPAFAIMTSAGAAGVDLATGKNLWQYPWKANYDLNIADPVINNDQVFVSSSYARIDALLQIQGRTPRVVWRNTVLGNQINSSVLLNGYLYGVDGTAGPTANARLKCVDWNTGTVKWTFPDLGGGALMIADGKIIAISDKGELFTAAASPQSFTPISRAQVLGGRCWTVPVLANGRIYCRNARGDLACLDVKPH